MQKTKKKNDTDKQTPLMKQYYAIKAKYPGSLVLFRVGDFYETFGEDAITTSKVLDIVLTKRSNGSASEVELAGFPHHALDNYLTKLVRAGYRVAICDQLEDPKYAKGIVKRGVTELVTPGLSLNDNVLDQKYNNYLASLHFDKNVWGIALLEYLFQVPANRIGYTVLSVGQLKILQEVITLSIFVPFSVMYLKEPLKLDYMWAGLCLMGAVYFMFRDKWV